MVQGDEVGKPKSLIHSRFDKNLVDGIDVFLDDTPNVISVFLDAGRYVVIFDQNYSHGIPELPQGGRTFGSGITINVISDPVHETVFRAAVLFRSLLIAMSAAVEAAAADPTVESFVSVFRPDLPSGLSRKLAE